MSETAGSTERGRVSAPYLDDSDNTGRLRDPARQESAIWRSLDDLVGTPEFTEFTKKEFPGFANVYESLGEAELDAAHGLALNRRQFLGLSAAALGLAGLTGCRRPDLEILPYSQAPDNIVPGVPLYYATSMPKPGGCFPILVESHEGRPTKIEGHPKHPASMGATDAHTQASILDLYSPDRSKQVLSRDKNGQMLPKTWEEFDAFANGHFAALKKNEGDGLHFLIENNPSPALRLVRESVKEKFPKAIWHSYDPIDNANHLAGTKLAFGRPLQAGYDFRKAYRIVSFDCDFLGLDGNAVASARDFAELRRDPRIRYLFGNEPAGEPAAQARDAATETNRLYVLENTYTVTGTLADHRLRIPAAHVVDFAMGLAKEIASRIRVTVPAAIHSCLEKSNASGFPVPEMWIKEAAADLIDFGGKGLVIVGGRQPAIVHMLAALINDMLGNTGKTVAYRPVEDEAITGIAELAKDIQESKVKSLVIVGGNPVYNSPADLGFAEAMSGVPTVIRFGLIRDETSEKSFWHLPLTHYLESWGDAETANGVYSVVQPLIAPLYNSRSFLEFLILIGGYDDAVGAAAAKTKVFGLLQKSFAKRTGKEDHLSFLRFIQEGFFAGKGDNLLFELNVESFGKAIAAYRPALAIPTDNLEITFHPSYALYDGRFAWNGWLLELPDPITKLVWDNAALVSPKAAAILQVKTGDMLEIETEAAKIKIPAFILPGQADDSIALHLGWGKMRMSHVAEGGGFDVYPLRTSAAMHFATAKIRKTGEFYELVTTQEHGTIPNDKDDDIIQDFTLDESAARGLAPNRDHPKSRFQWGYDESAYKPTGPEMKDIKRIALQTATDVSFPQRLDGHMQWGMVIDLDTCTGCSACVIACQAENNIPIVGKHEVKMHRQMHWISLHRYFMQKKGEVKGGLEHSPADDPAIVSQPMMCQHCESAPCESVCPVNAAVHSPEGLNLQVYNRCIGTRYCSNGCPYKVRRFNWFDFNKRRLDELRVPTPFSEAGVPETLKMQKNPEVTVRMRGVMEKCTYCIQRIERGKISAKVTAIKAGADKIDSVAPADPYQAGYDIRIIDGDSRIIVPDGIINTACAQACPTGAIVFGNVRDETSKVRELKNAGPDYLVLGSLNTKPRTSYLPRLRNLNPKMRGEGS